MKLTNKHRIDRQYHKQLKQARRRQRRWLKRRPKVTATKQRQARLRMRLREMRKWEHLDGAWDRLVAKGRDNELKWTPKVLADVRDSLKEK